MDKKRHGAKDHICEGCWNDVSEPDVLKRGVRILDETIEGGRADAVEVRAFVAEAIAEIKRLRRHDCENWSMEGIACARCNPIARELRAKFGDLDNRDAESDSAVVAPKGDTEE